GTKENDDVLDPARAGRPAGGGVGRGPEVFRRLHPAAAQRGHGGGDARQLLAAGLGPEGHPAGYGLRGVGRHRRGRYRAGGHAGLPRAGNRGAAAVHRPDRRRHRRAEAHQRLTAPRGERARAVGTGEYVDTHRWPSIRDTPDALRLSGLRINPRIPNPQSPIPNPQSPITNHQSPNPNPQSPTPTPQSPTPPPPSAPPDPPAPAPPPAPRPARR